MSYIFFFPIVWGSPSYPRSPRWVLYCGGDAHWAHIRVSEEESSSDVFWIEPGSTGLGRESLGPLFPVGSWLGFVRVHRPICWFWEFHPYNSPSKFRLLLSCPRRKGGILTFIGLFTVGPCFTCAEVRFSRASLMTEVVNDPCGANYCF